MSTHKGGDWIEPTVQRVGWADFISASRTTWDLAIAFGSPLPFPMNYLQEPTNAKEHHEDT